MSLMPRTPVPALSLETVGGGRVTLSEVAPEQFTMVVFYRGYHCPVCRKYVTELDGLLDEFTKRGVSIIVASSDPKERAEKTTQEWRLQRVALAYGLPLDEARAWGLYISTSRGKTSLGIEEPAMFSEPGLYLVRPDGTLYWGNVSTMPFARPHFT
jgi:peroxiredoxin